MYVKLTLKSNKYDMSNIEKRRYIDKLYPREATYSKKRRNMGMVHKFNNSIGFKNVTDCLDNYNCIIRSAIKNPDDYITPEDLIFKSLKPSFKRFEICTFIVKNTTIKHPINQYSFSTRKIMNKFARFLEKVFPETYCTIEILENNENITLEEDILNDFFLSISDSPFYTIEVSAPRKLTEDEVSNIINTLKTVSNLDIGIRQEICQTCIEHSNGENPYHIKIVYN